MRIRTTSTQRTYRYVRLSIVGVTLALALSIALQVATGGVLPSLSAAFYAPAGDLFVGALCAVALALLVLSGHSVEQALLDVAAVLALVVAFVPTPVTDGSCPSGDPCVPGAVVPAVIINGVAVASVVLLGLVTAVVLSRRQGTVGAGTLATAGAIGLIVLGFVLWAVVDLPGFLGAAHNVAAVGFFSLVGVVAAVAAWRPQRAPGRFRVLYGVVAVGILGSLAALVLVLVVAGGGAGGVPVVFVGESVVLALFAVFWLVQTVELWRAPDPALRA